ncbi:unnamed protein product [Clonostachys rhizophaga]|uniref:non-specific serine/threonine protein kinase n=1 Tax=Clonostachys rhizophaga TaxID=160324 RepID=A0A9N9YU24_9HYPO|nr:unnamed protein product [Clonostachys rhizophaga]
MVDQRSLKAIKDKPIGKGLDGFRASFNVMCEGARSGRYESGQLSTGTCAAVVKSASVSRQERSSSAGMKRPSSDTDAAPPPTKRSRPASPANASTNRVHRRVVLRDYGRPIYKASSPKALLSALEGCVEGHGLLYRAGLLHRDISINNLMVNEDDRNPPCEHF